MNNFICKICNNEFKNYNSLSHHITQNEKIKSIKQYYDKYILKNNENICNNPKCNNETNFENINKGYLKYCSNKCYNKHKKYITKLNKKNKIININTDIDKTNKLQCQICGGIYKNESGLSLHIKNHKTKNNIKYNSKIYYNEFYKKNGEEYCNNPKCNNLVTFRSISRMYDKYCSQKCNHQHHSLLNLNKRKNSFLKRALQKYKNKYNYNKIKYINNSSKVKIWCTKCKKYFWKTPGDHLGGCECECQFKLKSIGEEKIKKWLVKYNIYYIREKRFKNCKDKKSLPFDFYLPKYNLCIEFDGIHHYDFRQHIGDNKKESFKKLQFHDNIKNHFCIKNNIKLLRIPYWNNINKTLEKIILP